MREKQLQQDLDNMTDEQKFMRTDIEEFKKRGTLVAEHEYFYLTKNEYPHSNRGETQLVMWGYVDWIGHEELFKYAIRHYGHYNITCHPQQNKSVKQRPHLHIYD